MKKIFPFLIISIFLFAGCASSSEEVTADQAVQPADESMQQAQTFTLTEVAKHNNRDDCWLLIDGKVYDVTDFIGKHPGGETILEGCGKDATELFKTRPMGSGTPHSDRAREGMENYYIGDLEG